MKLLLIIILSICAVLTIVYALKQNFFGTIFWLGLELAVAGAIIFTFEPVEQVKNNIDLPEEHQLISHNKLKPDTLLGYYRNDTLVIEFKSK